MSGEVENARRVHLPQLSFRRVWSQENLHRFPCPFFQSSGFIRRAGQRN